MVQATRPASGLGRGTNPWLALLAMMFGLFMALLDVSIVTIALPAIVQQLQTDLTMAGWVLDAYSLVFAVLLVTVGRLADLFGRKWIFMAGMAVFMLGSLLCGLAPSIGWLIGFRAFQAMGAAVLNPVSLAILMAIFPREQRGAAVGLWGAAAGLATALGPVLGGLIVQTLSWRWIFYVNLPFCLVGLVLVWLWVPETREVRRDGRAGRLDWSGLLLLSVALFSLVLAVMQGNDWGWGSLPTLALLGLALVGLAVFVRVELRVREPMVNLRLFGIRSFLLSDVAILLFGVAMQGAFVMAVFYFTELRGYGQLEAAYALLPLPLASLVLSLLMGAVGRRLPPLLVGLTGLLLVALGFTLLALVSASAGSLDTAWRLALIGVGMGMCFQSFPTFALSEVPPAQLGVGSGILNTFRQVGFALGVAVLIALFTAQLQQDLQQAQQESVQVVASDQQLPPALRSHLVTALRQAQTGQTAAQDQTGGATMTVDLRPLAQTVPPGPQREALRSHLQMLGGRISAIFKDKVMTAFAATWWASAAFAALGLGLTALAAFSSRGKGRARQGAPRGGDETVVAEAGAVS
ncbi:MAG: DHA2 family efflux MFS transporter permease subunit [Thermogemmatispora sp.]|uniref:DHA2 family efflux MFS transporter permease subunit n=1 Tax=Thermogemmatispora sp. TaxID=1968838 RepID=UPI001A03354F|nr:DHA2 family efflux MFS transporter permease subunit [Thermogemmatispora sp.]MBE3565197.1 DHA2 family efflux MFS transporter permease subunit [Thermogemmatispora sp.]